jgi:hypothetical protein
VAASRAQLSRALTVPRSLLVRSPRSR